MEKLGTNYGGWYVPTNMNFDKDSVVYSGGVGEDISFDILLQSKYDCNIVLIDPTEKAYKHYNEVVQYYKNNSLFTGNIQRDYYQKITNHLPNLDKITYCKQGIWNCSDTMKFYKQTNDDYVSQSLINGMFGDSFDIVNVDTVKNVMSKFNHTKIDLLKLDIEGAENVVLEKMLDDKIFPQYLCIEFDLMLKNKDPNNTTNSIVDRLLKNNYRILKNDSLNITFKLN